MLLTVTIEPYETLSENGLLISVSLVRILPYRFNLSRVPLAVACSVQKTLQQKGTEVRDDVEPSVEADVFMC